MPYRYYAVVLLFFSMLPFICNWLMQGPGAHRPVYDMPYVAIGVTMIAAIIVFFRNDRISHVFEKAMTHILKRKALYIAIGYIIFLILFYNLLADHVVFDL